MVLALIITISVAAINSNSFSQEENTPTPQQQQQKVNKSSQSEIKKLTDNKYYDDWSNINENIITDFNSNISFPKTKNTTTSINQSIAINSNLVDNNDDNDNNDLTLGAWVPINNSLLLQNLKGEEQKKGIQSLLNQGFHEYYFSINNFEDIDSIKSTEELLKSAEKTSLKIIIILLPPSEGHVNTNYDWKGWIKYFNSLEKKYPKSFEGFTIDDFNWESTKLETKFKWNINFMEYSNLTQILEDKDKNIKFYPTIYFEGWLTDKVATKYNNLTDGFVVASGCYYNVSTLEKELTVFKEIFEKPIRYVVYPAITYNYSRQGYSPPTDQLIQATLSITSNSSVVDGLIIWHDIDKPVVQEYLVNRDDKAYLSKISNLKELQIREEEGENEEMTTTNSKKRLLGTLNDEQDCQEWSIKYNKAYDILKNLPQQEKENDKWKKEILDILRNDKINLWLWEDVELSSIIDILRMNYNKK
ncbi:MAG TPA: hypothetical protein VLA74_02715 [Nitrososphaeraceae archaeon]|nr:hypothetical protein [Nitrososphaeraceae archaeon]